MLKTRGALMLPGHLTAQAWLKDTVLTELRVRLRNSRADKISAFAHTPSSLLVGRKLTDIKNWMYKQVERFKFNPNIPVDLQI